jgi:hypothetical protein
VAPLYWIAIALIILAGTTASAEQTPAPKLQPAVSTVVEPKVPSTTGYEGERGYICATQYLRREDGSLMKIKRCSRD